MAFLGETSLKQNETKKKVVWHENELISFHLILLEKPERGKTQFSLRYNFARSYHKSFPEIFMIFPNFS